MVRLFAYITIDVHIISNMKGTQKKLSNIHARAYINIHTIYTHTHAYRHTHTHTHTHNIQVLRCKVGHTQTKQNKTNTHTTVI